MTTTTSRVSTPVLRLRRFHALWAAATVYLADEHQLSNVAGVGLRSIRGARMNLASPRDQTLARISRAVEILDAVAARHPEADERAIGAAAFREALDSGTSRDYALDYIVDLAVPVEAVSCCLNGTVPAW